MIQNGPEYQEYEEGMSEVGGLLSDNDMVSIIDDMIQIGFDELHDAREEGADFETIFKIIERNMVVIERRMNLVQHLQGQEYF